MAHSTPDALAFSPDVEAAYLTLHDFMYATVYVDEVAKREERKVERCSRSCTSALSPSRSCCLASIWNRLREGPDRARHRLYQRHER